MVKLCRDNEEVTVVIGQTRDAQSVSPLGSTTFSTEDPALARVVFSHLSCDAKSIKKVRLSTHEIYTGKRVAHTLSQVASFSENRWQVSIGTCGKFRRNTQV